MERSQIGKVASQALEMIERPTLKIGQRERDTRFPVFLQCQTIPRKREERPAAERDLRRRSGHGFGLCMRRGGKRTQGHQKAEIALGCDMKQLITFQRMAEQKGVGKARGIDPLFAHRDRAAEFVPAADGEKVIRFFGIVAAYRKRNVAARDDPAVCHFAIVADTGGISAAL